MIVITGLVLYFGMHIIASGRIEMALPFYMFFLSLPGNLFIGGLEETGWMYVLQPRLGQKVWICYFVSIDRYNLGFLAYPTLFYSRYESL